MAYIYRHIRLDNFTPFYIGIGKHNKHDRAFSKKNRNTHWNNIVNLTNYKVEIILDDITWEQACEKEKEFILLYRKVKDGGLLCNIADGGNGGSLGEEVNAKRKTSLMGHVLSENTKSKIREKAIGRKASDSTKGKMSITHKKNKTGSWLKSNGHENGRAFKVYQYSKEGSFIKEWDCAKYAIEFYNLNKSSISDCLKGRQKTAGGFIWLNLFTPHTNSLIHR
jgi:hypothetical protein